MKLSRQPLRIKLVALVLMLLTFAIFLIGLASNLAIGRYLTDKMDNDLADAATLLQTYPSAQALIEVADLELQVLPSDYVAIVPQRAIIKNPSLEPMKLPNFGTADDLRPHLGTFRTVHGADGKHKWRAKITAMPNRDVVVIAESMSDMDGLKKQVLWTTIYGGAAVLIMAATLGTELVRRSLRPLSMIERTAGAIAGGDLTRRVPDPEDGDPVPKTEVGSLARSLNSMLTQIEHAFTAQAGSEAAARAAETVARDAADAAQESEARALRSEEKMRQFVADASHELRTPLTTIRGFAELYRQGAVRSEEDTAALVKRIEDEARRMGLLVEDLLLLARMEQERPFRPLPVEMRVLAIEAVQAARVMAPAREIELRVAPDSGELAVLGDDARLRQVISNLMGNALAHTPEDSPVEVRLRRDGEQAVLEVADHGPGLDAEQTERVFERFYRADAARTRRADGHVSTGLGLAIVAALVAAHSGTVEVESVPGEGATFRVRLPLDAEAHESL
jgi:two-component system OmpR family sensor kinase